MLPSGSTHRCWKVKTVAAVSKSASQGGGHDVSAEWFKAVGGDTRTRVRDRRRSAGRRARSIASKLRLRGQQQRNQAQAAVRRITGELADIAEAAMREAAAVVCNVQRALRTATRARRG
jgi:hypothetical protein